MRILLLALLAVAARAEIPAFPGAEGAGMYATGGRGGTVYRVTNLNAEGLGSLAEAVSEPNRIVVFAVSGIIDLTREKGGRLRSGRIAVDQPNITIAGQSAPGEGICIKGGVLELSASNVIVRHLRSRRGFVAEGDAGDAIEVKPPAEGAAVTAIGRSPEALQKTIIKKAARGKITKQPGHIENIMLDHLSASWATDENLTMTHANLSTMQYCIAAEGLDYANPKQTPPNHSEGSLWGSAAPDGRSTVHHTLYAHNRLRNPRSTGGAEPPPVLTFYNNVVYDWSEYPSHTGSEWVLLNWLNNTYRAGPSTPPGIAGHMFEFHGDPRARIYAAGNRIVSSPEATQENRLGVFFGVHLRKLNAAEKKAMIVDEPFGAVSPPPQDAEQGYKVVLREAGATLPSRDSVDLRIVESVRRGTGGVIEHETDLPKEERWPEYRSLPSPADSDGDGLPDFWEKQFGLDPADASDSAKLAAGGYANIEHYLNNTLPTGDAVPIVYVSASVSRAYADLGQAGALRIWRTGPCDHALEVEFTWSGDAAPAEDPAANHLTIPAGAQFAEQTFRPDATSADGATAILCLEPADRYLIGCPSKAMVVIRK
jgi:hypothetical protein